jgi:hypothetical protein
MSNFWTPATKKEFHRAVENLCNLTKQPLDEKRYRSSGFQGPQETAHVLSLLDELQLADHIAFLGHSAQDVKTISAVCIEETPDGLLLRLASNHTPVDATVSGLRELLQNLGRGILAGTGLCIGQQTKGSLTKVQVNAGRRYVRLSSKTS